MVILNMTPVVYRDWTLSVSGKDFTKELFNSDAAQFAGTGTVYNPVIRSQCLSEQEQQYLLTIDIPALAAIVIG